MRSNTLYPKIHRNLIPQSSNNNSEAKSQNTQKIYTNELFAKYKFKHKIEQIEIKKNNKIIKQICKQFRNVFQNGIKIIPNRQYLFLIEIDDTTFLLDILFLCDFLLRIVPE